MTAKTLLREAVIVYRCPFCRKSWQSRGKRYAERHFSHCFKRPDRQPYIGEVARGPMPEEWASWWPGDGKIWDGKRWRDIPGYHPDHTDPEVHGKPLGGVKPWVLRLEVFDDICLDSLRYRDEPWDGPLRTTEDADVIRAIHGTASPPTSPTATASPA